MHTHYSPRNYSVTLHAYPRLRTLRKPPFHGCTTKPPMSPVGPNAEYAMFGDWLSSLQNRELFSFYGGLLLTGIGMETEGERDGGRPGLALADSRHGMYAGYGYIENNICMMYSGLACVDILGVRTLHAVRKQGLFCFCPLCRNMHVCDSQASVQRRKAVNPGQRSRPSN